MGDRLPHRAPNVQHPYPARDEALFQEHERSPRRSHASDRGRRHDTHNSRRSRDGHRHHHDHHEKPPMKTRHRHISAMTAHMVAASGEFVGTVLFLWFAFAWHLTVAGMSQGQSENGTTSAETVMFISIGYGFSLLISAWCFYRISGGLFNPAVILGLVLTKSMPAVRGLILLPAQILGGIVAAALVLAMFPGDINVVQTKLADEVSIARGVFIEMFLTSLLVFTILMLAAEKSKATFIAPIGIGLALFVAELAGVYYTGGSLNPSRSFGPAVVSGSFVGYHWLYWVGPAMGSLLAAIYFRFVKYMNYEEANPGQDSADGDFDPERQRGGA